MKRVMFVTNSLTGGGAERSMNLVSNELTDRGWQIALVPINQSGLDQVLLNSEVFPLARPWPGNTLGTLMALWKFVRLVKTWKPEILILNCDLPETFGAMSIGKFSLIVVEHSDIPWAGRTKLGKLIRKVLSIRSAIWVTVSESGRIWPFGKTAKLVIQNPIMAKNSLDYEVSSSSISRLVFIGRLSSEKQPAKMLEISRRTRFPVQMIGDGRLRGALEDDVAKGALKVEFSGHVIAPWSHLRIGDLLLVPSDSEGDGLVVIEGMQMGVPMLLADIPIFRRFGLPDRNYCRGVEDFALRIKEYKKNIRALVAPKSITDPIIASRSISVVGDAWEDLLNSI